MASTNSATNVAILTSYGSRRQKVLIALSAGVVIRMNEHDVCECGDYRRQHEGGTGKCHMPDDMCHGMMPCTAFVLAERVVEIDEHGDVRKPTILRYPEIEYREPAAGE